MLKLKATELIVFCKFKIFITWLVVVYCSNLSTTNGQILKDTTSLNLVRKGIEYVYDQQFNSAHEIYDKINRMYPKHPVVIFFRGMMTYWENYPLLAGSVAGSSFEKDMRTCIELSGKKAKTHDYAEFLLANLCARGILITYYSDNDLNSNVFHLASSTYRYIRQSFGYTSDYSDFFFFTGLYNYYREVYPKVHPAYKPLVFLFPKGNRVLGLKELNNSASNSLLLKAESYSILSYIFMSYENDYLQALSYSKNLHELYPANLEFLAEYIKNLILIRHYNEADDLIKSSLKSESNPYYKAQVSIFTGIIKEKEFHQNTLANEYYNRGIKELSVFGALGNEYSAYAYFGLSRICKLNGDIANMKAYRKKALEKADIKKINFDE